MTLLENKIIIHFTSQVTQMVDMAEKLSQKEVCEILFDPIPVNLSLLNQSKNSSKNYIVASSILDWLRKNTKSIVFSWIRRLLLPYVQLQN